MTSKDWDAFILACRENYETFYHRRGLCVERDWDEIGNLRSDARCPYTRVRFVATYDGMAWFESGASVRVGTAVEVW